jgi:Transglycosylase SLT domain
MGKWARENDFDDFVRAESARYSVPVAVIKATIATESGFNPGAYRMEPALGDASRGLMQVLLSTARGLGYNGEAGNDQRRVGGLYDPWTSIQLGTFYLARQAGRYPDRPWTDVYAAYNAGSLRYKSNGAGKVLINAPAVALWRKHYAYFAGDSAPPDEAGGSGDASARPVDSGSADQPVPPVEPEPARFDPDVWRAPELARPRRRRGFWRRVWWFFWNG